MVFCDSCQTWQHTDCAGIPNTREPPADYRCQTCRLAALEVRVVVDELEEKHHREDLDWTQSTTSASASTTSLPLTSTMRKKKKMNPTTQTVRQRLSKKLSCRKK